MGRVWRAHHTALKRDDALKVLPDAFAADPERLARFQREAQALASLNHPNIAHVHGLEDVAGIKALVMELVEGPTLADRIAHGALPIDEALHIAKQIAEAFETRRTIGSWLCRFSSIPRVRTSTSGRLCRYSRRDSRARHKTPSDGTTWCPRTGSGF